jgi:hypothetical protein
MDIISAREFLNAFAEEWYTAVDGNTIPPGGPYGDRDVWKDYVEAQHGLIARVLCRLRPGVRYCREGVFRFDGACVTGDDDRYPVTFAALIEHELNNRPEEEMQKLILSRAPLKVLIFYDWGEHEKTSEYRRHWVEKKLGWFATALVRANAWCPESATTCYVFLVGSHSDSSGAVEWLHASNFSLQPTPLARRG